MTATLTCASAHRRSYDCQVVIGVEFWITR